VRTFRVTEDQGLIYAQARRRAAAPQLSSPRRAYELIRASIRSGSVGPGDPLLEHVLVRALGTSRNSVRKALQILAEEGVVTREVRDGTRVRRGISMFAVDAMVPPEMLDRDGQPYRIEKMYRGTVTAPEIVQTRLGVTNTDVLMIEYLAILGQDPLYVRTIYFPLAEDNKQFLDQAGALIDHPVALEESFAALHHTPMGLVEATLEAVPCEGRTATLLGVCVGAPVLLHELALLDTHGLVREVSYTHYRGDRAALVSVGSPGRGGSAPA
jgi:GntR family transcriptional regulator